MLVSVSTLQADRGIWAIGDVHGCLRSLEALYARIAPRRCYLIGDLVGKGPDSKGVLDFAMRHSSIISMMGNHEDQLLKAYVDDTAPAARLWLSKGGSSVLSSFGVDRISKIPRKYREFMLRMPYVRRFGNTILSHAGVDLHRPQPYANRGFILYNRSICPPDVGLGKVLVVGHTPVSLSVAKASANTTLVRIDGGCFQGGRLIAYNLHTHEIVSIKSKERS